MNTRARRRWIRRAFDAHGTPLLRFTARLVGEADARDIVQQTFLKLWTVDPPPDDEHLAPWLYTVCRRAAIDLRRKESTMLAHQHAERAAPVSRPPDAEMKTEVSGILARVEALPAPQREVLRLRFTGGLAYKDIAEATGKPIGTVSYLMHQGIRALRADLGEGER